MMLTRSRALVSLLATLLGTSFLVAGCSQRHSATAPVAPSLTAGSFRVTEGIAGAPGAKSGQYRRIWPHEDGRGWAYRLTSREWDIPPTVPFPQSPDDVPILTIDDAINLLATDPDPAHSQVASGTYRLRFNGLVTTLSGVTRQNLEESVDEGATATAALTFKRPGNRFLALLRRARPDLARKMGLQAPSFATRSTVIPDAPILLHGYAWEQTDQWIGTYGDLNQQIAWIFLTPNLKPGAEFSLQLVPDLADNVYLHARVVGWTRVETAAGVFHRALDVVYLVDFGASEVTDVDGNTIGYYRPYLYGRSDYVAGVGPVYSRERFTQGANQPPASDIVSSLTSTEAPLP